MEMDDDTLDGYRREQRYASEELERSQAIWPADSEHGQRILDARKSAIGHAVGAEKEATTRRELAEANCGRGKGWSKCSSGLVLSPTDPAATGSAGGPGTRETGLAEASAILTGSRPSRPRSGTVLDVSPSRDRRRAR